MIAAETAAREGSSPGLLVHWTDLNRSLFADENDESDVARVGVVIRMPGGDQASLPGAIFRAMKWAVLELE